MRNQEKSKKTPRTWRHKARIAVSLLAVAAAAAAAVVVIVAAIVVAVGVCWVWVRVASCAGRGGRCGRSSVRRLGT